MADVLRVIITAKGNPDFRGNSWRYSIGTWGDYVRSLDSEWHVTEEDISAYISAMRVRGRVKKTIRDRVYYIRWALAKVG